MIQLLTQTFTIKIFLFSAFRHIYLEVGYIRQLLQLFQHHIQTVIQKLYNLIEQDLLLYQYLLRQ